jgi:hypothetical protein
MISETSIDLMPLCAVFKRIETIGAIVMRSMRKGKLNREEIRRQANEFRTIT